MALWKTRQDRIGVFTRDQRKLDVAIVKLNDFEVRINTLKDNPFGTMDARFLAGLVEAWAQAYAFKLAATYDRGSDVKNLEATAERLEDRSKICDTYPPGVAVLLEKALALAEAEACKRAAEWWRGAANP